VSVLDDRIRRIAREEAEGVAESAPGVVLETSGPDRLTELEQEVADLRSRLEKLESVPRRAASRKAAPETTE
jgi:folylpolyglutamate synthase/dihydropteroate synthase